MATRVRFTHPDAQADKQISEDDLLDNIKLRLKLAKLIEENERLKAVQARAKIEKSKAARRDMHWYIQAAKKEGRPPVYCDEHEDEICRIVYDYRLMGIGADDIAALFGLTEAGLYHWRMTYPKFFTAWEEGGDGAEAKVVRKLHHRALGYSHAAEQIMITKDGDIHRAEYTKHYPPDVAAAEFFLTNRKPNRWKKRSSTELTGKDGEALAPPSFTVTGVIAQPRGDHDVKE